MPAGEDWERLRHYIRNGGALETAATLNTLVFDKTGTITEGKPAVTDFLLLEGRDEARILALVAEVEAHSEHFLAHAISAWCRARAVSPAPTRRAREPRKPLCCCTGSVCKP